MKYRLLLLLLLMFPLLLQAAVITEIRFEGNKITKETVLLQEMQTRPGDLLDTKQLDIDMQAIMDLALFRHVYYVLDYEDETYTGNVVVTIYLREKYYLFVLPRIDYDDDANRFRYGVYANWHNMGGWNRNLTYKLSEHGQTLGTYDTHEKLSYTDPRVNGSLYQLEIYTRNREAVTGDVDVNPQDRREDTNGITVSRWFNKTRVSSGWYAGVGIFRSVYENTAHYDGMEDLGTYRGDFLNLTFGYRRINEYLFNRRGKDFGIEIDTTRLLFVNDQEYVRYKLFYRSYYRLKSAPMNNLNVQVRAEVSEGDYLGDVAFGLGRSSLRGYPSNQYTGNALLAMNIEYLMPFDRDPKYRYGYLFDVGNCYDSGEDIDITNLHPSVGMGFRWKLAAFVKVDLRVDVSYGIDEDNWEILAGSRHVF